MVRISTIKFAVIALSSMTFATSSVAVDFGSQGPLWKIIEPSILDTIKARLGEMEDSGELLEMQQEMQDTTRAYVNRPRPVLDLLNAEVAHEFEVDMSVTLTQDLMDHQGRVFARAGTVVNPLDYTHFNQRIVIFDGDNPDQVAFALSEGNEIDTLLVLVNGAPLELMREHGRRFYFDQDGQMVEKFQISRLPSEVFRGNRTMIVRETPVGPRVNTENAGEVSQ